MDKLARRRLLYTGLTWNLAGYDHDRVEGYSNTRYPFAIMCKKFGIAYIQDLEVSYMGRGPLSDELFCQYNGNIPKSYFEKYLKKLPRF